MKSKYDSIFGTITFSVRQFLLICLLTIGGFSGIQISVIAQSFTFTRPLTVSDNARGNGYADPGRSTPFIVGNGGPGDNYINTVFKDNASLSVRDLTPPVMACNQKVAVALDGDDPNDCYLPGTNGCAFAGVVWLKAKRWTMAP